MASGIVASLVEKRTRLVPRLEAELNFISSFSSPEIQSKNSRLSKYPSIFLYGTIYYFYSNSANFFLPLPLYSKLLQMHNSNTCVLSQFNNHVVAGPISEFYCFFVFVF